MEIPKLSEFDRVQVLKKEGGWVVQLGIEYAQYHPREYAIETWERVVAFLQLIGEEDAKKGIQET